MCPSVKGGELEVLDLLTASWSIETSIYHVYEEQTCRFPESLLQQFNFQRAEETTPVEENEEAETEWELGEDQQ